MKLLKYILIFSSLAVFSQNEFKKKTLSGTALPTTSQSAPSSSQSSLFSLPKPSFSKKDDTFSKPSSTFEIGKKKRDINLAQDNGYVNPNIEVIKQQNEKFKNFDLGVLTLNSNYVIIKFRDFISPDGDIVRILHNHTSLEYQMLLEPDYKQIKVNLIIGENNFEFLALNEGQGGGNTAEFIVVDETGKTVFANQWVLLPGEIGRVIINKEK